MSKYNLIDIYEGMSEEEWENAKEEDRLEAHPDRDKIKAIQALIRKEKGEVEEVTSRVGSRIEGLLSIPLKAKFLEAFADLYFDLTDEDPFHAEDVVDHLAIEMLKHLDAIQAQGDKLAGVNTDADFEREQRMQMDMREEDEDELAGVNTDADFEREQRMQMDMREEDEIEEGISKDDIKKALKGTKVEIETYMDSLKRSGDKFDSIEDYVEDFENYVADKALQEHFSRFMKDYQ